MDVTQVLLAAQSPDVNIRTQAEQQILQAETANMVRALQSPAALLSQTSAAPPPRVCR